MRPSAASGTQPVLAAETAVWLIRHGQTQWSRSGRHTSRTDLPLTGHGRAQALALRPLLCAVLDTAPLVLCSPRLRATDTAALAGLTAFQVLDDLAEWDYGDYEGLTYAQIRGSVPDWSIWTHGCPGGESPPQAGARAERVVQRIHTELTARPQRPIVLIGHSHLHRAIAVRWLGCPISAGALLSLDPAAPCLLGTEHGRPAIARWNAANPLTDPAYDPAREPARNSGDPAEQAR